MISNPEINLRPGSPPRPSRDLSNFRGRRTIISESLTGDGTAQGSDDPAPMAAPRAAKCPRRGPEPANASERSPAVLPDINPIGVGISSHCSSERSSTCTL